MSARRLHGAALLALSLLSGAASAASELKLYPIAGLFMAPAGNGGSLIHPQFQRAIDSAGDGKYFAAQFRLRFPDAVDHVGEQDKRYTLVSSLQVGRASFYSVDKIDGTSDLFVPVSGSLYFTNVVSGEVLYTVSATYYYRATVNGAGAAIGDAKLQSMFKLAYQGLVAQLLDKAREQFKPHVVSATVKREWHGLYILDQGQDAGIVKGDAIADAAGNTLDVVYSAPAYAVGTPNLGKIATGVRFAHETNLSLADIKKPRVLVLVDQAPAGIDGDNLRQMFTDVLGAKAPVSVVHVNALFADVLKTAFASTDISGDNSRKRELPDFFIRLSVPESRSFEMPTTLKHKMLRSYRSIATAELVDRSGRVLYAGVGEDRIDDEVTSGMGFDGASRREVSVKNALLNLAEKIGAELKFDRLELPLQALAPLTVKDGNGALLAGENLVVFRDIGKVDGVAGTVRLPIRGINVDQVSDGAAGAVLDALPTYTALPLQAGDVVLLDSGAVPRTVTRKRFAACGPAEQLGAFALPAFGELALNGFERNYKAPYFSTGFFSQLQTLLGPDSRFKSDIKLTMAQPDYCVEPVYRVDVGAPKCDADSHICTDAAAVRITFRIKNGATVVTKSGLETTTTSAGYLSNASDEAHKNSLATDLLGASAKLATEIAVKLNKEKLN